MVDTVAREIGMDPVELRRRNVVRVEDLPYVSATGLTYDRISPAETLEQAVELVGYDQFRREQQAARAEGRYLGVGFSLYVEPSQTRGSMGSEGAVLRIDPSGTVTLMMGTASHGQSTETTMAQLVADELGIRPDDVVFVQGDTAIVPWGPGTGGSRTAVIAAAAAQQAGTLMRDRLVRIAAHALEASPGDLELVDGSVRVVGDPQPRLTLAEVAERAYLEPESLEPGTEPGLMVSTRSQPPPLTLSNACHACVVEVDVATGRVQVLRYVVSEDCGRMINPMVVEGQIAGGVVQGIGGVLFEHMVYDHDGNPLTTTFLDYLLPTAAEVPEIEYGHIETPADSPGGFKGMGEGGAIGSPPAVVNAVADALAPLGVRLTGGSLGPAEVRTAITAAQADGDVLQ
jgi:carbon-monoxide dehydrogenase large subunit